ncbi:hypothetical protein L0222_24485 [bacterium]|nr:hypothetical protein [bacterium]MCI0601378.1 hypothetical protein [bacterium]
MEFVDQKQQVIAWILLWMWIALTIFIFSYKGTKSVKVYIINLLLLIGSLYLFFVRE